jgi:hypothetical protein
VVKFRNVATKEKDINLFREEKEGRMMSSGLLRRVALVGTEVSEELSSSFIRVTIIGELGTLAVASNRHMLFFFVACVGC